MSSYLDFEFQPRGFLGLGNSGSMCRAKNIEDFPGIFIRGDVFAGIQRMEGTFYLSIDSETGRRELGSIDCSQVELKNSVAVRGDFVVSLAGQDPKPSVFPINFSEVSN